MAIKLFCITMILVICVLSIYLAITTFWLFAVPPIYAFTIVIFYMRQPFKKHTNCGGK